MPAHISWYQADRVILAQLEGDQSIEDISQVNTTITEMLRVGKPRVHIIVDTSKMGSIPLKLSQLAAVNAYLREPNLGTIVTIGMDNILIRFLASMVSQIAHIELKTVTTLDEGVDVLRRIDQSLGSGTTET